MSLLDILLGKDGQKAREEAVRLGISVTETQHGAEVWDRHSPTGRIAPFDCIKYSIPRTGTSHILWSFDQVFKDPPSGPYSSNPYFFKSPGGQGGYLLKANASISDAMKQVFTELAQEYCEEFFAFEGAANEVSIYWEEFGGIKRASQLCQTLRKLREL